MKDYDVVVVGAGNAGLSAALNMVLKGQKTLLIEQHNLPGGCATSFVRGRFEIEPSLHELCDVGPVTDPGDVRSMMDSYGVDVDWICVNDCFRIVGKYSDGTPMDVTMPSGVQPFIDKMEEYVPGSKEKVTKLFDLFEETRDGIAYITASAGHADSAVLKRDYPNMLRTGSYPTSKVFKALKLPQKCQDILSTYWSYLGVDMDHLSFIHYAAMVQKYVSRAAYIPKNTSHGLSSKMIARFQELGGEVWYGCRAESFLFDGEVCVGVRTNVGDIKAKCVLPNINSNIVYGKMVPKEIVPERIKKLANARGDYYGARMITAYFCLDKTAEELGIKDYSIFLPEYADSAKQYDMINEGIDKNGYSIFLCYNIADPEFSPKGTCVCSFTTFGSKNDFDNIDLKDYPKMKEKIARKFLAELKERTGIDISGSIEEIEVATPLTFSRYLNAPEGSVYGHETRDKDGMMARMMSLAKDYPIKGLKPIGTDGPRGDGYSAAYICGQLISNIALKEMKGGN